MGEKELGVINFGFDSEVQIEMNMEKALFQQTAVSSLRVHIISLMLYCSDLVTPPVNIRECPHATS